MPAKLRTKSVAVALPLIVKTKGVCGGKARVAGTRLPVWGIEESRQMGWSVEVLIEQYPALTEESILAAWEYARSHRREIERQIKDNREC